MKKHIILSIVLFSTLTACKKSWLEVTPFAVQLVSTTDDYDKVMNNSGIYYYSTGGYAEQQLMGDEVAAEGPFFANRSTRDLRDRFFQWRDSIYPTTEFSVANLTKHLNTVYEWNKVIKEVMSATGGTEERKRAILADAQAQRAWSNFNMVQTYCKPYVAATAGTDPGFPVITNPDVTESSFPRGTVQQSYDFIIKDLTEALASIPMKPAYPTRWSKPAVEGILGKVYLFMGKYNEALPLLKAALADVAANGSPTLYNYNTALATGGSFLPIDVNTGPANAPGNLQNDTKEALISRVFFLGAYNGNLTGNDGLVLTPQTQALYGASDKRLLLYTNKNADNSVNAAGRIRKYGVRYGRWGLQLPDLLLLSAEVKARTNDLAGAITDVETLRKNRMPAADATVPSAIAGDQTALVKFIIDERIREFAMEGFRWWDMRRLSVDPLFAGITFTHTLYNADGTTTVYTLSLPNRLTMMLPRIITDTNPDMENNP